jgi:DNA-binding winged helix-turn-helix (wHTH) protein
MRLRFGGFTFDPGSRQLFRVETEVHLSPKAFELLQLLTERRPHALSKAQLQQHLWPMMFVSEASLPMLMGEVRKAPGDDVKHPRFIRTLQRFGYAFCGDVTETSSEKRARKAFVVGSSGKRSGWSCWKART